MNCDITQARLKELLAYNQETGDFTWKVSPPHGPNRIGAKAGSAVRGYIWITINHRRYCAHRLAWVYMTGRWPRQFIDHINCIRGDNRFCNLREANAEQNARNKSIQPWSATGIKGVTALPSGRFQAQIYVRRKGIHLGIFDTAEEASAAYASAANHYFGEFAHPSVRERKDVGRNGVAAPRVQQSS